MRLVIDLLHNAIFVEQFGGLRIYRICDLDLFCMKLTSFRAKDEDDLNGLINDMHYLTQSMLTDRLHFLYGSDALYKLKQDAISYVRTHIHR